MSVEVEPGIRSRKRLAVAGAAVVVVVAVSGAVVALTGSPDVPYTDKASTGGLTLCDGHGNAVTEGKLTQPLAAVVLGDTRAPKGYDVPGAVASLFAYQPRAGVGPDEFSGLQLTGSSAFRHADQPAVDVTKASTTLGDFVTAFPAQLDGYVQLRLLVSAPRAGTLTTRYDSADLRVQGDRWRLVRGGTAHCSAARTALIEPTS